MLSSTTYSSRATAQRCRSCESESAGNSLATGRPLLAPLKLANGRLCWRHSKIEIGGTGDSTSGSEDSHERTRGRTNMSAGCKCDTDCQAANEAPLWLQASWFRCRASCYLPVLADEVWFAQEAVKRNRDIVLYALPWSFPQWVEAAGGATPGSGPGFGAAVVGYLVDWVVGFEEVLAGAARLSYLGLHNERHWEISWALELRAALDAAVRPRLTIAMGVNGAHS